MVVASFHKGAYSERKEFAPMGSKFFPFNVDRFCQEKSWKPAKLRNWIHLVDFLPRETTFLTFLFSFLYQLLPKITTLRGF